MSNGTIKSWVKGVERRQRILSKTSFMRVEFKYENKAVPTELVAGTEAERCRGDETRRDATIARSSPTPGRRSLHLLTSAARPPSPTPQHTTQSSHHTWHHLCDLTALSMKLRQLISNFALFFTTRLWWSYVIFVQKPDSNLLNELFSKFLQRLTTKPLNSYLIN